MCSLANHLGYVSYVDNDSLFVFFFSFFYLSIRIIHSHSPFYLSFALPSFPYYSSLSVEYFHIYLITYILLLSFSSFMLYPSISIIHSFLLLFSSFLFHLFHIASLFVRLLFPQFVRVTMSISLLLLFSPSFDPPFFLLSFLFSPPPLARLYFSRSS